MKNDLTDFFTDKQTVSRNFNAAAVRYDAAAALQKIVAGNLLERLELMRTAPSNILDLGSGTGWAGRQLAKRYRHARVIQLDLAQQMLWQSRRVSRWFQPRQMFACGDAARLPFAPAAFDMIYSNLMLQWCNDPHAVFVEARRVLKPGGLLLFSSFGPDTLHELRTSWATVDSAAHVNTFIDMHDLGDALVRAGFQCPVMERENFTLTYDGVAALFRELKSLGARNANTGRRKAVTGKARLQKAIAAYETFRVNKKIPATYEVLYGHAWRDAGQGSRGPDQHSYTVPVSTIKIRGK